MDSDHDSGISLNKEALHLHPNVSSFQDTRDLHGMKIAPKIAKDPSYISLLKLVA